MAVAGVFSEDADERTQGLLELQRLIKEDVEDPLPYKIFGDYLFEIEPSEAWAMIRHCIIRSVYYGLQAIDDPNDADVVSQGYNKIMRLGLVLRDHERHEEATHCFVVAMRYEMSAWQDQGEVEKFDDPAISYAYSSAEEADGEKYGELTRMVEEVFEDIRGINDDD